MARAQRPQKAVCVSFEAGVLGDFCVLRCAVVSTDKKKAQPKPSSKGSKFSNLAGNVVAFPKLGKTKVGSTSCSIVEQSGIQEHKEGAVATSSSEKIKYDEWVVFVTKTPAMTLRKQFVQASNSHKNMRQRRKTHGAIVSPEFETFKSFLIHMGPPPAKNATVDRRDPNDPEYSPAKVRWADKATQANNKTNTLLFHCSKTGVTYTASDLAKKQKVDLSTIHKRRKNGWKDDEVIAGKRLIAPIAAADPEVGYDVKQGSLASAPSGELAPATPASLAVWMNVFVKFKDHIDIVFAERVQERLFAAFPEVKMHYYSPFATAVDFSTSPKKRWGQLHALFPITLRIVEQVADELALRTCQELGPEIAARYQTRRNMIASGKSASDETERKDDEWAGRCEAGEIDQAGLTPECFSHLEAIGVHILDAFRMYVSPECAEQAKKTSFPEFVMGL